MNYMECRSLSLVMVLGLSLMAGCDEGSGGVTGATPEVSSPAGTPTPDSRTPLDRAVDAAVEGAVQGIEERARERGRALGGRMVDDTADKIEEWWDGIMKDGTSAEKGPGLLEKARRTLNDLAVPTLTFPEQIDPNFSDPPTDFPWSDSGSAPSQTPVWNWGQGQ